MKHPTTVQSTSTFQAAFNLSHTTLDPTKPVQRILNHPQCLEFAGDPKEPRGLHDADDARDSRVCVGPE